MSTGKVIATIDITPTWEAATRIYIACLLNPKAGPEAHQAAETDLLRLARLMDAAPERMRAAEEGAYTAGLADGANARG